MSNSMDDRRHATEALYAQDQQSAFKIEARTCKLVGLWAAGLMGFTGTDAENYAKDVIAANLDEPGFDDIKRKLAKDFATKSVSISDHMLDLEIQKHADLARQQIVAEAGK